jgi:hypothetical protein
MKTFKLNEISKEVRHKDLIRIRRKNKICKCTRIKIQKSMYKDFVGLK